MIIKLLMSALLLAASGSGDSLENFQKQLGVNINIYMGPPPDMDSSKRCYHYTELLKVEINKNSKVVSMEPSDSAPAWLRQEINKVSKIKNTRFEKLDSLALKAGLHNCTLVFPLIIESDEFPCGQENKKRSISENYFQFGGKNLKGNIFFGNQIKIIWPVKYVRKL